MDSPIFFYPLGYTGPAVQMRVSFHLDLIDCSHQTFLLFVFFVPFLTLFFLLAFSPKMFFFVNMVR